MDHATVTRKIELEEYDIKNDLHDENFDMKDEFLNIQDTMILAGNKIEQLDIFPEEANKECIEAKFLNFRRLQSLEISPTITLIDAKEESKNISASENSQPMLMLKKDSEQTNALCTLQIEERRKESFEILEITKTVPQCEQRDNLPEETFRKDGSMNIKGMLGPPMNQSKLINTKEDVSEPKIYLAERVELTEFIDSRMETGAFRVKDGNISTNETNNKKFSTTMEKCITDREKEKCCMEKQATVPNKKPKEVENKDQSLGKTLDFVPSATEVK